MTDWKHLQMIKASGWPLAPEALYTDADFNARLEGGLVPLHWACRQGKAGLVKYMIEQGARVQDRTDDGAGLLELAAKSGSFQCVMLLIDRLKAERAPLPDEALRQQLTRAFADGHPGSKNRLQQTFKDWERLSRQGGSAR